MFPLQIGLVCKMRIKLSSRHWLQYNPMEMKAVALLSSGLKPMQLFSQKSLSKIFIIPDCSQNCFVYHRHRQVNVWQAFPVDQDACSKS